MKQIAILGSTGSIGTQTLDVVRQHRSEFAVYALTAHRSVEMLIQQALEFNPAVVCIADETCYPRLRDALSDLPIKVMAGDKALEEIVTMPAIDVVVAAMVGYAGLPPTIAAIKAKKTIALANKETLVVAGEIICRLAQQYQVDILPVDSEHSAIFQCIEPDSKCLNKILLTASGGPFRGRTRADLENIQVSKEKEVTLYMMVAPANLSGKSLSVSVSDNQGNVAVTKLDGTAKGGVVIGISDQFKIPVRYIGLGEGMEDLQPFNRVEFVDSLFK